MRLLHSLITGRGEPLLILHGFLGMSDNWKTLANRFADDFEVHLVDQRNHGRSFHDEEFSYELMMEDLIYYMGHHGVDSPNIMGHSMGGKTAMTLAVEYPDLVRRLIVADIAPRFYPQHHQDILSALTSVDFEKMRSRNDIDAHFEKYVPEYSIRQFLLKNVYRKERDRFAYRINLESLVENIEEIGVALPPMTSYDGPALFMKGENSGYIAAADEALIKAHFPNYTLATIQGAGHWLHAENPEQFHKTVVEFLKNH
jgi:pimeloyl-ACP methyl ester carboxylesterase